MSAVERTALRSAVDSGKLDEALTEAEKSTSRDPRDPEAAGVRAALLFRLDRRQEALAAYRSFASSQKEAAGSKALEEFCVSALDFSTTAPNEKVRLAAIESIEKTAMTRWNEVLHKAMLADPKPDLRQAAAHSLRRIGGKGARDLFRKDLASEDGEVRKLAADALVRLGDDSPVEVLKTELASPDTERRRWAARELVKLHEDVAIAALAGDMSSSDRSLRLSTVYLMDEIGSKAAVPEFKKALGDADLEVRRAAAHALVARSDPSGLEVVREELRTANPAGKLKAIGGLDGLGTKEAIPDLKLALKDPDAKVQEAASNLLEKFGDPEGKKWKEEHENVLKKAAGVALLPIALASKAAAQRPPEAKMADQSRHVRAEAAREAAELGADQGRPVMLKGLEDKDALVRQTAIWSAAETGDRAMLPALVDRIDDPDPRVRLAACGAVVVVLAK